MKENNKTNKDASNNSSAICFSPSRPGHTLKPQNSPFHKSNSFLVSGMIKNTNQKALSPVNSKNLQRFGKMVKGWVFLKKWQDWCEYVFLFFVLNMDITFKLLREIFRQSCEMKD